MIADSLGDGSTRFWTLIETDWGWSAVVGDDSALDFVGYPEASPDIAVDRLRREVDRIGRYADQALAWATGPVADYFAGKWLDWGELPVRLAGTPLQVRVWQVTREIGHGQTRTYSEVAADAGWPRAARAAGSALARNPAGLLVPCHRVVAAGGIGGYGGWLDRKRALLRFEGSLNARNEVSKSARPGQR